jgi:hypothetical protein
MAQDSWCSRSAWFNIDWVWAAALNVTGMVVLVK